MSEPTYRDAQMGGLLKELRGLVKNQPAAKAVLEKAEKRLRFILRVVEGWDAFHADRAEILIGLGKMEAANSAATMIFEPQLRADLYRRSPILLDSNDRVAEALELEREVIE